MRISNAKDDDELIRYLASFIIEHVHNWGTLKEEELELLLYEFFDTLP